MLYAEQALAAGMALERVPALNSDPQFIEALAELVLERCAEAWPDA